MFTLTTSEKAPLLDGNDAPLAGATAVSNDNAIAYVENQGENLLFVVANSVGTCTVSATRGSETATLDVEVVQAAGFQILLGTPVAK